jgi:hypothetical protein
MDRLSSGEKIAGVSAVLLFIAMFFAWFGYDTGAAGEFAKQFGVDIETSASFNAWESFDFIDLVLLLTIVVTVGAIGMRMADMEISLPASTVVTLLGAISTLLIVYRIIDPPGDAGREWGVWLGLILAGLITYGGYRAMDEEGTSFGDAADHFSGGPGAPPGGEGGAPPPPPSTPQQ